MRRGRSDITWRPIKAQLSIRRSTDSRGAILSLSGELDASSASELEDYLQAVAEEGVAYVILDLSGLSFVDSAGVSVLVRARQEAEERGERLILSRPTPQVHGVFALVGLAQWLSDDNVAE